MDDRQMTSLALLQEVQKALNHIPRKTYRGGQFHDTYQLAAEVDRHVEWAENNKEDADV